MSETNDQQKIALSLADVKATSKDGVEHTTRVHLFELGNAVIKEPQPGTKSDK